MRICLPDLAGRTALVTGAANGIGRATARALADQGARLILCDIKEAELRAFAAELGPSCLFAAPVDVADREAMRDFAAQVHARVPALDVLVNNAGVGVAGGLLDTPLADWDWLLSINLGGVVHGCHFFVPNMVAQNRPGYVVNLSSVLGYFGAPDLASYVTSKFAVFGLSESLRNELRRHRIGVAAVCPGIIDTGIVGATRFRMPSSPQRGDAAAQRDRISALYRKRNYPPERVAAAIVRAIRRGEAVVPVSPEAWAFYIASRLGSGISSKVSDLMRGLVTR